MNIKPLTSNALLTVLFIIVFWFISKIITAVLLFIPVLVISFIVYYSFFDKREIDSQRILPIYLIALANQFFHFLEEYLTDFCVAMPGLINDDPYPLSYWVGFNMVAYAVFILGANALFANIKQLFIIPIFFIIAGVFFNSIGHIGLSFYTGGYFPGLYTAILYVVLSFFVIKQVRLIVKTGEGR